MIIEILQVKLRSDLWESVCCRIHVIKMAKITVITLVSVSSASCVSWLSLHNVGLPAAGGGICHGDTRQHWCWVVDPLQLFVANDRLSVHLSLRCC